MYTSYIILSLTKFLIYPYVLIFMFLGENLCFDHWLTIFRSKLIEFCKNIKKYAKSNDSLNF